MTIKKNKIINFGIIKIKLTLNNLFITLTDLKGNVLISKHSGLRFKSYKRKTPYVAGVVLKDVMTALKKSDLKIKLFIVQIHGHEVRSNITKSILKKIKSYKLRNVLCLQYRVKRIHNGMRLQKKRRV